MEKFNEQQKKLIAVLNETTPGYSDFFVTPQNTLGCIAPFIYTKAILADLEEFGYERRWCYSNLLEAKEAINDWIKSNAHEPSGYIRKLHLDTVNTNKIKVQREEKYEEKT